MAQEDHTGPYQPFYGTAAANEARRPIGGGKGHAVRGAGANGRGAAGGGERAPQRPAVHLLRMQRTNGATGQVNRLREAQREMSFCTVLVARDPQGKMHMLRGF